MLPRPPRSNRTDTRLAYTTLSRSPACSSSCSSRSCGPNVSERRRDHDLVRLGADPAVHRPHRRSRQTDGTLAVRSLRRARDPVPSPARPRRARFLPPRGDRPHRRAELAALRAPCCSSTSSSEEHTSELQSLMRISYAVFCLKKQKKTISQKNNTN